MKKYILLLLLMLTMLFWGANFHVTKIALEYHSPMLVAAYRFFFGVVSLFLIVGFKYRKSIVQVRFTKTELWYIFLTAFFGIFLTIYFFNLGLQTTSAVNGSLIIATSPAITAVLTYFFLNEKNNITQWLAIILSFIGVTIILVKGDINKLLDLQFEIGDLFILCMAIVFTLSQIIISKYIPHIEAILMTTISCVFALILFISFSIPEFISTDIPREPEFWYSVLFMGILGTGIAYSTYFYCVIKLGATTSTLFMNLIPFFAVVLAFPFGEPIKFIQIVGGSIIIIGLITYNYSKHLKSFKKS